jgi:hypothetical protein
LAGQAGAEILFHLLSKLNGREMPTAPIVIAKVTLIPATGASHYYGRIDAWRGAGKLVQDLIDEASLRGSDESCTADRLEDCGRRSPLNWKRDSG